MSRYGEIYIITCAVNGKQYIGQTTSPLRHRFAQHRSSALPGRKKYAISSAIRKYGIDNFDIQSLASCFNREALDHTESLLIKEFNTASPNGYNLCGGGNARKHSEATRRKISLKAKGRGTGIPLPEETRKRMSISQKARPPASSETRKKMSIAWKGKKKTPEHVEKIAAKKRGKKQSAEAIEKRVAPMRGRKQSAEAIEKRVAARRGKLVPKLYKKILDERGTVYESVKQAAEILGIPYPSHISEVLSGTRKQTHGHTFSFQKGSMIVDVDNKHPLSLKDIEIVK